MVEVDHEGNEVLVHFTGNNSKYKDVKLDSLLNVSCQAGMEDTTSGSEWIPLVCSRCIEDQGRIVLTAGCFTDLHVSPHCLLT